MPRAFPLILIIGVICWSRSAYAEAAYYYETECAICDTVIEYAVFGAGLLKTTRLYWTGVDTVRIENPYSGEYALVIVNDLPWVYELEILVNPSISVPIPIPAPWVEMEVKIYNDSGLLIRKQEYSLNWPDVWTGYRTIVKSNKEYALMLEVEEWLDNGGDPSTATNVASYNELWYEIPVYVNYGFTQPQCYYSTGYAEMEAAGIVPNVTITCY